MPTIAIINGVRLVINLKDDLPPHLHALYGGFEAQMSIETGDILNGKLPLPQRKAVQLWLAEHRNEVAYVWDETRNGRFGGGRIDQ